MTEAANPDEFTDADFAAAAKAVSDANPAPAPVVAEAEADDAAADQASAPAPAAAAPAPAPAPAAAAPAPAAPPAAPPTLEELQTQLRDSQQRERSSAGRISEFARKSNELELQVRALNEKLTKLSAAPAAAPAPAAPVADEEDVLTNAPDLERAVARRVEKATRPLVDKLTAAETRLEEVDRTTAAVQQTLEPFSRQEHKTRLETTFSALDETFTAAWRQTVQDPGFHEWLAARPQRTQELYRNAVDPSDCAEVLDLFYVAHGGRPKPTAPPPSAPPTGGASPNDALRASVGIPPSRNGSRPAPLAPDDFDGAFAAATAALHAEKARNTQGSRRA